jgi:hypothetical protein
MERLVCDLDAELKSRRMADDVTMLRRLYAARKQRRESLPAPGEVTAIEWACMLRTAPFESVFLEHPRQYRCPCRANHRDSPRPRSKVFPASSTSPALQAHWCHVCGAHWTVVGSF